MFTKKFHNFPHQAGLFVEFNVTKERTPEEFENDTLADIFDDGGIMVGSDYCSTMYIVVPKIESAKVFEALQLEVGDNCAQQPIDVFFALVKINDPVYDVIVSNWDDQVIGDLNGIEKYTVIRSGGMADDHDFICQSQIILSNNKFGKAMKEFSSAYNQEQVEFIFATMQEMKEDEYKPEHVYVDHIKDINILKYITDACLIIYTTIKDPNDDYTVKSLRALSEVIDRALTIQRLSESTQNISSCLMNYKLGSSNKQYSFAYNGKDYIDVRYGKNCENGSDVVVSSSDDAYKKMRKILLEKYKKGYDIVKMNYAPDAESEFIADEPEEGYEGSFIKMFNTSYGMGQRNQDAYRTYDYVKGKCMEELGELNVEIQIEQGLSYKKAGKDGIAGEAVDLAITAMDMFALTCDNMPPEEMQKLFIETMNKKLDKWIRIVTS